MKAWNEYLEEAKLLLAARSLLPSTPTDEEWLAAVLRDKDAECIATCDAPTHCALMRKMEPRSTPAKKP
jgi:hypothetical protein